MPVQPRPPLRLNQRCNALFWKPGTLAPPKLLQLLRNRCVSLPDVLANPVRLAATAGYRLDQMILDRLALRAAQVPSNHAVKPHIGSRVHALHAVAAPVLGVHPHIAGANLGADPE